jgi:hypothetical protein
MLPHKVVNRFTEQALNASIRVKSELVKGAADDRAKISDNSFLAFAWVASSSVPRRSLVRDCRLRNGR